MFSSAQWSPGVRLCGDDEDDERIFGILPVLSVCCIFILVCEAHHEKISYAVQDPLLSVCLVYSSLAGRVHVIELNIVAAFMFRYIVSGGLPNLVIVTARTERM